MNSGKSSQVLWAVTFGLLVALTPASAAQDPVITSVFSHTDKSYSRQKLPDGTFQREYYVITNGEYSAGAAKNDSIDKVKFPQIAGLMAQFLAKQNYYLADTAKSADFLLKITWGTTIPFGDGNRQASLDNLSGALNQANAAKNAIPPPATTAPATEGEAQAAAQAEATRAEAEAQSAAAQDVLEGQLLQAQVFENMRRDANVENARLLGYLGEINERDDLSRFAGAGTAYDDLIADIEEERYYVIIAAYDFKAATEDKKLKVRWATRVSIATRGNRFNETLAVMLAEASKQFGRDSGKLIRRAQEGKVRLGDLKYIGTAPATTTGTGKPPETK